VSGRSILVYVLHETEIKSVMELQIKDKGKQ